MIKISKPLLLASNSPRRKEIMQKAGFEFEVEVRETDELFSETMVLEEVPVFLAETKAKMFLDESYFKIILTADTVVIVDNQILNKPMDYEEAFRMLKKLSNKTHKVVTGFCVLNDGVFTSQKDVALVKFKELSDDEINYYIEVCKPFDKAGSYGAQDFIGMIGMTEIVGSFYTIIGLPIHKVYEVLKQFTT